jgi:hypothetical protein
LTPPGEGSAGCVRSPRCCFRFCGTANWNYKKCASTYSTNLFNFGPYGRARPAGTACSTAVPWILLTRKRPEVQLLPRPHTSPDQRKRELSVLLDRLAGSQRGWNEPAQRSRALYLLTSLCPCEVMSCFSMGGGSSGSAVSRPARSRPVTTRQRQWVKASQPTAKERNDEPGRQPATRGGLPMPASPIISTSCGWPWLAHPGSR